MYSTHTPSLLLIHPLIPFHPVAISAAKDAAGNADLNKLREYQKMGEDFISESSELSKKDD